MGGSGGGGSPQPSSTTTTQEMSPEQRQLLSLVIPEAEKFSANPPELFPGSTIAPLDPLQGQAQQQILDLAAPGGALFDNAAQVSSAQNFLLSPELFSANPALDAATAAAVRPITQSFEQNVLPNIRGGAVAAGQFGGSRQGIAEGLAAQSMFQSVGDTSAKIQAQAFQDSLDAMVRTLLASPETSRVAALPAAATEAVGMQRQGRAQAALSEEAQRHMAEQLIPFNVAQDIAALAFGFPGGTVTSNTALPGGGGGGFNTRGALGGAASGATIGSLVPGIGTGIGALIGGGLGAFA